MALARRMACIRPAADAYDPRVSRLSTLVRRLHRRPPVEVGPVRLDAAANRAEAMVDGTPLWFAADGAALRPSAEAFLCACALPAALARRGLRLATGADPAALAAAQRVLDFTRGWWPHPAPAPGPAGPAAAAGGAATALCFSGGVDSFHTLLTRRPDWLLFGSPFDSPADDRGAAAWGWAQVQAAAAATGARAVRVRTNLRSHPLFARSDWQKVHGGALVALAHLLPAEVGRLLISASYPLDYLHPWGTHPHLDPLWSTPALAVEHAGAELTRADKLAAIGTDPVVRGHLRVCWETPAAGNCGRCEKCLRTRLVFWRRLPGTPCATLPPPETLAADLGAMPRLPRPDLPAAWRRFFLDGADPADPVTRALADLIARSA